MTEHTPPIPTASHAAILILGLGLPVQQHPAGASLHGNTPAVPKNQNNGAAQTPVFSAPNHPALATADVLVGGKAQLAACTPHPAEKIILGADVESVYAAMKKNLRANRRQVVLCSGDPLFFGLGARLIERFGNEHVRILPGTSSLQAAAAFLRIPWENARAVSLHGRQDFLPLAHALRTEAPVFLLTDAAHTPQSLAAYLSERGHADWALHILDNLFIAHDGTVQAEKYTYAAVADLVAQPETECDAFLHPAGTLRILALLPDACFAQKQHTPHQPAPSPLHATTQQPMLDEPCAQSPRGCFGIPDANFSREHELITKAPVRALGLAAMQIQPHHVVWDLGAGSGSVGIEAASLAWQGLVIAVERNAERVAMIQENRRRFKAAHLEIIHASLPDCLLPENAANYGMYFPLQRPHGIFIGGGLGGTDDQAKTLLSRAWEHLLPGGRIVLPCVLLASLERARAQLAALGASVQITCLQASTSTPLGTDIRLQGMNPVFLVQAQKQFT